MTVKSGPDLELQTAIVTVLKADADVKTLLGAAPRINPVQSTTWPGDYIQVGDGQNVPDLAECIDGSEVYLDIHIWSQADGSFAQVNKIAATLWAVVGTATLTLSENKLIDIERGSLQRLRDPDGKTLHGVLTIKALTEPAA